MKVSGLFKHYPLIRTRSIQYRKISKAGVLSYVFTRSVAGKEVEFPVPVAEEIYSFSYPHRFGVIASSPGLWYFYY